MKQNEHILVKAEYTDMMVKDFLVSGETFHLVNNEAYACLETKPQPSPSEIGKYYQSDEYISHTDSQKGIVNFLYQQVKVFSLSKKVRLIGKLNQGKGTLLDVGAGTGDFLIQAQKNGWKVHGVEVDEEARNRATEKGLNLTTNLDAIKEKQFDVITLWHVLEHMHDLKEQIQRLQKLLKKDGSLVIAVPNHRSFDARYYGRYWAAYDVPRHLWHFSRRSIEHLFSSGFILEETLPMVFDAYYVSLLSEKHKTGNDFSIKAFWIGLKSNWLARRTKEYSSLIYCLRKTE